MVITKIINAHAAVIPKIKFFNIYWFTGS